jgi:hypothetical protein
VTATELDERVDVADVHDLCRVGFAKPCRAGVAVDRDNPEAELARARDRAPLVDARTDEENRSRQRRAMLDAAHILRRGVEKVVAIHQPNFLPWLGWFDKLARADVFVLLDHVQFPRTSKGTYVNRVKLLVNGSDAWVTAPIVRARGSIQRIDEVRVDDAQPWRDKLLRTILHNYSRAPAFDAVFPLVREILERGTDRLAELNEHGARQIARALELDESKFVRSSSLRATERATDLLIELTKAVGGTTYLAGNLAGSTYQEDEKFAEHGVQLRYQEFRHPEYPQQVEPFVPGLSVVDALMHCGPAGTRALLSR